MIPVLELESGGTGSWSLRALRVGRGASGGRAPACCSARSASAPEVETKEGDGRSGPQGHKGKCSIWYSLG